MHTTKGSTKIFSGICWIVKFVVEQFYWITLIGLLWMQKHLVLVWDGSVLPMIFSFEVAYYLLSDWFDERFYLIIVSLTVIHDWNDKKS